MAEPGLRGLGFKSPSTISKGMTLGAFFDILYDLIIIIAVLALILGLIHLYLSRGGE